VPVTVIPEIFDTKLWIILFSYEKPGAQLFLGVVDPRSKSANLKIRTYCFDRLTG
jgi:hypothetical protein